jgi:hypothetical protein
LKGIRSGILPISHGHYLDMPPHSLVCAAGIEQGLQHSFVGDTVSSGLSVAEKAWATSIVVSSNVAVVTATAGHVVSDSQDPRISPHVRRA